jgi:hypothetical protein
MEAYLNITLLPMSFSKALKTESTYRGQIVNCLGELEVWTAQKNSVFSIDIDFKLLKQFLQIQQSPTFE